jgi:GH24 family phage-related lysozyme (muramidase)
MASMPLPTATQKTTLFNQLKKQEGSILYMYLDTKGNVTIGIGFLLASAQAARIFSTKVPFYKADGKKATMKEVETEYKKIKKQNFGVKLNAAHFKKYASLTVKQINVDAYLKNMIDKKWKLAAQEYGKDQFDKLPEEAKFVLFDIQFNTVKGVKGYPKLVDAMKKEDWKTAKTNATRPDAKSRALYCQALIQKIIDREAAKKIKASRLHSEHLQH